MDIQSTGCCERFDPAPWQDKEHVWENKIFIKDHVICAFHIPLNMKSKVIHNMQLIQSADVMSEKFIMLSDEKSLWSADLYFHVTKEIPDANMVKLSGTFLSKVFDGHYSHAPKWAKEMQKYVQEKGLTLNFISSIQHAPNAQKHMGRIMLYC